MYFLLILYTLLLYLMFRNKPNFDKRFLTFETIALILVSALRNKAVGNDTYRYILGVEWAGYSSWNEIFSNFAIGYINPTNATKDPGFIILEKLISIFTTDQIPILFIYATLVLVPLAWFLKTTIRGQFHYAFAYILFITLFYSNIPNQLVRQSVAFVIMLYAIHMLSNNMEKKALTILLIATFFHKSVFAVLLLYLMYKFIKPKYYIRLALLGSVVLYTMPFLIMGLVENMSDVYLNYLTSSYYDNKQKPFMVFLLIGGLYSIIAISFLQKKLDYEEYRMELAGASLGLIFLPLILVDPNLYRLVAYCSIWYCILVPKAIDTFPVKRLLYFVIIAIFAYKTYTASNSYKFYWEYMELNDEYAFIDQNSKFYDTKNINYNHYLQQC